MKNFKSTTEGTWLEVVNVELTGEERLLMRSRDESDNEERDLLMERIKSERDIEVTETTELDEVYNSLKPELKEGDIYQLIGINLTERGSNYTGILNCRVNGKHLQIRL